MVLWVFRMANETEHHLQRRLGTVQNQPVIRSLVDLFEMTGRYQHNRSDVRCLTGGDSISIGDTGHRGRKKSSHWSLFQLIGRHSIDCQLIDTFEDRFGVQSCYLLRRWGLDVYVSTVTILPAWVGLPSISGYA